MNKLSITASMLLLGMISGCTYMSQGFPDPSRAAETVEKDFFGDSSPRITYLDQNWDASDSLWFYNTTQGSDLIPYEIFLHLEKAGSTELFRSSENMRQYRYLTQNPSMGNPDGLPVGFVSNDYDGKKYLGLTCAACHTTQINYKGVGIRIDGGPALADMDAMLLALEAAMKETLDDGAKFSRFVQAMQASGDKNDAAKIKDELTHSYQEIAYYNKINKSVNGDKSVPYGYARLDAFGRIFNRILGHIKPGTDKYNSPNAPVSYPFLWDTPRYDFVQWNGIGNNNSGGIAGPFGPLGRNTGEVLGVFATFEVEHKKLSVSKLSADKRNLVRLEAHLDKLAPPKWPENILGPIDREKAQKGAQVFIEYKCQACHVPAEGLSKEQREHGIPAQFSSLDRINTDTVMATNATSAKGYTGVLEGMDNPLTGKKFSQEDIVAGSLTKVTADAILAPDNTKPFFVRWAEELHILLLDLLHNPVPEKTVRYVDFVEKPYSDLNVYKARSLDGIWATAPYLHNGSVPNLYELFLPSCTDKEIENGKKCRSNKFNIGSREFDPVKVGFLQKSKSEYPGLFTFDTSLPGNSNRGHEYAAGVTPFVDKDGKAEKLGPMNDQEREELVEYLKTL